MRLKLAGMLCLASLSGAGHAADIIDTSNGKYNISGQYSAPNTVTGDCCASTFRSFYVFDLTGQSAATAISITFYGANGVFKSDKGTETIGLYDYTGSVSALTGGTAGVAAYTDLGSGTVFGQYTLAAANESAMPRFTIQLSAAFVSQYNGALVGPDKTIALGAALTSPFTPGSPDEAFWWQSTLAHAAYLTVTPAPVVPELPIWAMMMGGFALAGGAMRRGKSDVQFG